MIDEQLEAITETTKPTSPSQYTIEEITPELWRESKQGIMEVDYSAFGLMDLNRNEDELLITFADPDSICFAARDVYGKVVGYISASPLEHFYGLCAVTEDPEFGNLSTTYIEAIAVLDEHQEKGIGGRLIDALADEARGRGLTHVSGHFLPSSRSLMEKREADSLEVCPNWAQTGKMAEYMSLDVQE